MALVWGLAGCSARGEEMSSSPDGASPRSHGLVVDRDERRWAALGPLGGLDPRLRRVLDLDAFTPLPPPRPGSWRDRFDEPGQGYSDFVASRFNVPAEPRDTLVLLPLGSFPTELVVEGERI